MTRPGARNPGGEVPDAPPGPAAPCATALSPRAAALLAYSAWWVTGLLFLLLEPDQPFVRFHARQAFWGFGLIWTLGLAFFLLGFVLLVVSPTLFAVATGLAQATWGAGLVAWVVALVRTWRGDAWRLPILGRWATREGGGDGRPGRAR